MFEIFVQINKYAFSGGQETVEKHRELGGNCEVDIAYQYLRYFLEDDDRLEEIRKVTYISAFLWFLLANVSDLHQRRTVDRPFEEGTDHSFAESYWRSSGGEKESHR